MTTAVVATATTVSAIATAVSATVAVAGTAVACIVSPRRVACPRSGVTGTVAHIVPFIAGAVKVAGFGTAVVATVKVADIVFPVAMVNAVVAVAFVLPAGDAS